MGLMMLYLMVSSSFLHIFGQRKEFEEIYWIIINKYICTSDHQWVASCVCFTLFEARKVNRNFFPLQLLIINNFESSIQCENVFIALGFIWTQLQLMRLKCGGVFRVKLTKLPQMYTHLNCSSEGGKKLSGDEIKYFHRFSEEKN